MIAERQKKVRSSLSVENLADEFGRSQRWVGVRAPENEEAVPCDTSARVRSSAQVNARFAIQREMLERREMREPPYRNQFV
jgi:hypothetical protein